MQCHLIERLFQSIQTIHKEAGIARDYGAGMLLYHSEVTLLELIHRCPEQSAATLAEALGITNGALTQTARKLMDKGLIEQYSPPTNRKLKYHRLTESGETARQGHAQHHQEANARMRAYLCTRSPEEKQVLMDFFTQLEACSQICLYECEPTGCACHPHNPEQPTHKGGNTDVGA